MLELMQMIWLVKKISCTADFQIKLSHQRWSMIKVRINLVDFKYFLEHFLLEILISINIYTVN